MSQGSDELVTGNTFSPLANMHFDNHGVFQVGYYYCGNCNNEDPDDTKIYQVTDKAKHFNNSCPSHYGGHTQKDLVLSEEQKLDQEQLYFDNLLDYHSVKTLYDNLVDGGNTEAELTDIQNAEPDDMWALREQLLGDSPHLSIKVLKEVSYRTDVFTESALFDILAANPDELKKDELINYLEDKEDPLPDYMIAILREVAKGTTYKTVLLQRMSFYRLAMEVSWQVPHLQSKAKEIFPVYHIAFIPRLSYSKLTATEMNNGIDVMGGVEMMGFGTYLN